MNMLVWMRQGWQDDDRGGNGGTAGDGEAACAEIGAEASRTGPVKLRNTTAAHKVT